MPRYTPKTFAEARAITDPTKRADALLKLSQEAEDRRRAAPPQAAKSARPAMRKANNKITDEQRRALEGFLKYWRKDLESTGPWSNLIHVIDESLGSGEIESDFGRKFDAAYQGALDEYDDPTPSFKRDPEELATALTNLTNALYGTAYEPNFRNDDDDDNESAKASRPRMRKSAGRLAENSRVIRTAEGVFAKLMADDYFSKTYSESDLADAAVEIAAKMTGSGPKAKKIVRETGNMFI